MQLSFLFKFSLKLVENLFLVSTTASSFRSVPPTTSSGSPTTWATIRFTRRRVYPIHRRRKPSFLSATTLTTYIEITSAAWVTFPTSTISITCAAIIIIATASTITQSGPTCWWCTTGATCKVNDKVKYLLRYNFCGIITQWS